MKASRVEWEGLHVTEPCFARCLPPRVRSVSSGVPPGDETACVISRMAVADTVRIDGFAGAPFAFAGLCVAGIPTSVQTGGQDWMAVKKHPSDSPKA